MNLESKRIVKSINRLNRRTRGTIEDISKMLGTKNEYLKEIIEKLPKSVAELEEISEQADFSSYKLWKIVCDKSLDYMISIAEFYKVSLDDDYNDSRFKQMEMQEKDEARRFAHDALISSINPWMRALVKNGVDISFLTQTINKDDRISYGDFGLGIALEIFISEPDSNSAKSVKNEDLTI